MTNRYALMLMVLAPLSAFAAAPGSTFEANGEASADDLAEHDAAPAPSRAGLAMKLAGDALFGGRAGPGAFSAGAFLGGRYGLFERRADGTGPNLALALLGGVEARSAGLGGLGTSSWGGGEARVEFIWAGETGPLEPVFRAYLVGGWMKQLDGPLFETRFGGGVGLNWLPLTHGDFQSGGLGNLGGLGPSAILGLPIALAVMLFAIAPTVELQYHVRSDGTSFPALTLACGL